MYKKRERQGPLVPLFKADEGLKCGQINDTVLLRIVYTIFHITENFGELAIEKGAITWYYRRKAERYT